MFVAVRVHGMDVMLARCMVMLHMHFVGWAVFHCYLLAVLLHPFTFGRLG